MNWHDGLALIW